MASPQKICSYLGCCLWVIIYCIIGQAGFVAELCPTPAWLIAYNTVWEFYYGFIVSKKDTNALGFLVEGALELMFIWLYVVYGHSQDSSLDWYTRALKLLFYIIASSFLFSGSLAPKREFKYLMYTTSAILVFYWAADANTTQAVTQYKITSVLCLFSAIFMFVAHEREWSRNRSNNMLSAWIHMSIYLYLVSGIYFVAATWFVGLV